jgi:glutamyl endopeptidase
MPKSAEKSRGGHTPVTNLSREAAAVESVKRSQSMPPARGSAPESRKSERSRPPASAKAQNKRLATGRIFLPPTSESLRDIGEASFGPPRAVVEIVHGPDDRQQINDTAAYPWSTNASLAIVAADNSAWIGTGWFIGPRTLVTAGHCVYIRDSGVPGRDGWVQRITVMPGRNGSELPFGAATSNTFRAVTGWTEGGDPNFDYGVLILPVALGEKTGSVGFGAFTDDQLRDQTANIAGYPSDKDPGTLWYDSRQIASLSPRKVYYDIDTAGGQSGSAVYCVFDGARTAIAVHTYGDANVNSGTRITDDVYNNLVEWRQ